MKGKVVAPILVLLVLAVGGGLYFIAPLLETPQEKVDRHVERETERARRLLVQFDTAQQQLANIQNELKQRQIDLDLTPEQVAALLERNAKAGENINKNLEELLGSASYRKNWSRVFGGSPDQASIGVNPDRQQRELAAAMQKARHATAENRKRLEQADRIIGDALHYQIAAASGTVHPEANRVSGMILKRQADDRYQQALRSRNRVESRMHRVSEVLLRAKEVRAKLPVFNTASVDEQIARTEGWISDLAKQRAQHVDRAKQLEAVSAEIRARISEARARAEAARIKLDQIVEEGYQITDPKSFEAFTKAYEEQAALSRAATAEANALEFGRLKNARVDERHDPLRGPYVPVEGKTIEVSFGVSGLDDRLQAARHESDARQRTIELLRAQIKELETVKKDLSDGRQATQEAVDAVSAELKQSTEALQKLLADAAGVEEDVLNFTDQAAARFSTAARMAGRRHPSQPWITGELQARRADTFFLAGSVLARRVAQLRRVLPLYKQLETFGVSEVKAADIEVQLNESLNKGLESLHEAWELYQGARGSLGNHFSVVGNMAAVQLALARAVGKDHPSHEAYWNNAATLLNAIADKEHPDAAEFVQAMTALNIERRKPTPTDGAEAAPEEETPSATQEAPEQDADARDTVPDQTSGESVENEEKRAPGTEANP